MSKSRLQLAVLLRQSLWMLSYLGYRLVQSNLDHLLVLTYHRVTPDIPWSDSLVVTPDQFEQQVKYLKRRFRLLSAHEVADIIRSGNPFPVRSCLLTFDDGWKDNYTHAFPVLQAYKIPALIFLTTGYVGTNKRFWHERLASLLHPLPLSQGRQQTVSHRNWVTASVEEIVQEVGSLPLRARQLVIEEITEAWKPLEESALEHKIQKLEAALGHCLPAASPAMLSWENVATMAAGGIEFGSHTVSHALLDQVTAAQLKIELCGSKETLESRLGKPVEFIAYPNGNYNEAVIRASQVCGYLGGFTCEIGFNVTSERPFQLKRKHVLNELSIGWDGQFSNAFFAAELSGIRHDVKAIIRRALRARYQDRN